MRNFQCILSALFMINVFFRCTVERHFVNKSKIGNDMNSAERIGKQVWGKSSSSKYILDQ